MATANNFFTTAEITAMIARTIAGESCPADAANLEAVADKWGADRTAKALIEWPSYAVAAHDGGARGLIGAVHVALDTPARLNPLINEMESQQYHLTYDSSCGKYSCDCEDFAHRIEPLNRALYKAGPERYLPGECKHGLMIDLIHKREVEADRAKWEVENAHRELAELEAQATRLRAQLGIEPATALPDVAALVAEREDLAAQLAEANRTARVFESLCVEQQNKLTDLRADLAQEQASSLWWQGDNERLKAANDRLAEQIALHERREALTRRRYSKLPTDAKSQWRAA